MVAGLAAPLSHRAGVPLRTAARRREFHGDSIDDGLYIGRVENLEMELRLDADVCGVLSADLFTRAKKAVRYVASFRTAPGVQFTGRPGDWPIVATFHDGADSGVLRLTRPASNSSKMLCEIAFASHVVVGAVAQKSIAFEVAHRTKALRRLTVEVDTERGCKYPPEFKTEGRAAKTYSVGSVLAAAGIEIKPAGKNDRIASRDGGWSEKDLPALMKKFGQKAGRGPSFHIQILWLSKSNRPGLLGVMFDTEDNTPRQSLAIFTGAIKEVLGPKAKDWELERKLVHTTVHEIGHALNLAHRFEREVGRADSLSCMNYDWMFGGGDRVGDYWRDCQFTFDQDELEFLRHGPWRAIAPGGAEFHSVQYWDAPDDDDAAGDPEIDANPLELSLATPEQPVFAFGQPVVLGLKLRNQGTRALRLPGFILDQKAGFLVLHITRVPRGRRYAIEDLPAESFQPIVRRCYDLAHQAQDIHLRSKASYQDNVNVTFGSSGFPFAEPGEYAVTAVLGFSGGSGERIDCRSDPVRFRVAAPEGRADENEGVQMLEPAMGRYLSGFARTKERDALLGVYKNRVKRKGEASDGVCAHAARVLMFDLARTGDASATELAQYVQRSKAFFDAHTYDATSKYIGTMVKK